MGEWKEYKLGDITTEIGDGIHGTPNYSEDGEFYFINGNNISNGKVIIKGDTKRVNRIEFEKYKKLLSNRTILLSINGTIGNVGFYNNEKCILGKSACYFNLKDNVDKNFVYYTFLTDDFQSHLLNIATGTTIQNVPLKGLRESIILLPPLDEQKRIASILSSLDDKIDLLHRENKTLEAMAETLFRQWFIEEAKEDDMCLLGEVIKTTSGGTPSRKNEEYYCNGNIEWVKSKELHHSYILDTEEKITVEAVHNSSAKLLPENSILIAMYGATVGEYGIIAKSMTCNQAICALIPNEKYPYTYLYLWAKFMQDEFINLACGAAQQNISQELIKQQYVSNDIKLISDFHILVNPYMEKMKVNQEQIQTLIQQRDSLLPKLMSGEVKI